MAESRKCISAVDLESHNKPGDMWICIQGKIYDVSIWEKEHPGGSLPLLNLAGKDATDSFVAYHPGTAWKYLDKFFNGYYLEDYSVSDVSKDYRKLMFEFTKMGLFENKGHVTFVTLTSIAVMFAAILYGVIFSGSILVHFICSVMMGFLWIQSGWIGHDSGHYQVMPSKKLNRFTQILTGNCLAGISIAWWRRNHNAHHIACNSLDHDPDLQHMPLFAVSNKFFNSITSRFYNRKMNFDSISRFLISYQHLSFYPVMCVARINLFAQSIVLLLSGTKVPNRVTEMIGVLVYWIWFPTVVSFLPNWGERVMFILVSFAVTGIQHVQFCLNHFSSNVYLGKPTGNDWFQKQTMGTLNISCPSWMDWFHGGLQFQIEHHLFPRLPRSQLRKVSPFVKDLCKKHNLVYNIAPFLKANMMTIQTLKKAAIEARDLTTPVPKNLIWEALNTHG